MKCDTQTCARRHTEGADRKKKEERVEGDEREVIIQSEGRGGVTKTPGRGQRFGPHTSKGRQVQDGGLPADPNIAHNRIIRLDNLGTHLRA